MRILGYDYKIVVEVDHDIDTVGRFDGRHQLIRIAPDQTQQAKESTILHEIIEALAYHLNLELPADKNKTIIPLEAGLYQVLTEAGIDLSPLTKQE